MQDLPALAHRFRFLGALAAWGLFALASPGVLSADGSVLVAMLGAGVWGHVEARPFKGRAWKGFLAHALGALPGAAALMLWIRFIYPPPLAYIGLGMGLYSAGGGVLLRRLLVRVPAGAAPLAVALAWTAMETLRTAVPMPFGLGWMRVGYQAHAWLWLAGSARVWGVTGLTFALASAGGLAALAWRVRGAALRPLPLACGLGPLALGAALGLGTGPGEFVPGPRLLLVQPGFSQERKQLGDPMRNFSELRELTRSAVAAERAAGAPEPDLVCWGESMLYTSIFVEGVEELTREGARGIADGASTPSRRELASLADDEEGLVRGLLFGRGRWAPREPAPLPEGTSFLAGAEVFRPLEGEVRRFVAAVLYGPQGQRAGLSPKRFLVPGAETMYGLERVGAIEGFIREVSGYVPDFAAGDETGVLELPTREGRSYAMAATVCFDNAHLPPYTDPVRDGPVDFHVVVSNEAWYRESFEVDQMVAFSRIAALASGRALVRATNSGISLAMGADGREIARIREGGRDRMVRGYLGVQVPVPDPDTGGGRPPIAFLRPWLDLAWVALPLLLAGIRPGSGRNRDGGGG